jgi:glycosyltransferase involved in cell wall biosynthesis
MKRLSVLIPMYNVEPYVERCLRSLEGQDIPRNEYEIICINDGSPDNSRGVVERLQHEFDNIILMDQENQGVSVARNNGMDRATGKYLFMVDPDDFLLPNVFKERLDIMDRHDLEVGLSGYIILDEAMQEEYRYDPTFDSDEVVTGIDLIYRLREDDQDDYERDPHRSVSFFFNSEFLRSNDLRYLTDVPFLEDGELMARIMCLASRATLLNEPVYMRTTRPGSATHSRLYYSDRGREGFLKAAHNLYHFKQDVCKNEDQKIFINEYIVHFTMISIASIELSKYFKQYSNLYQVLKKGPLKKLETDGIHEWYRKMGNYYNRSIHCFYLNWFIFRLRRSLRWRVKRVFSFN